jgi:hypothetical protein
MATYRQLHTKIWDDKKFKELSALSQHLFIYLFTNSHRNEACLYEITIATISYESKLTTEQVHSCFEELESQKMAFYDHDWGLTLVPHAILYQSPNNRVKSTVIQHCNTTRSNKLRAEFLRIHQKEDWYLSFIKQQDTVFLIGLDNRVSEQCSDTGLHSPVSNNININNSNSEFISLKGGAGENFLSEQIQPNGEVKKTDPTLEECILYFEIHGFREPKKQGELFYNHYFPFERDDGRPLQDGKWKKLANSWNLRAPEFEKKTNGKSNGKYTNRAVTTEQHNSGW